MIKNKIQEKINILITLQNYVYKIEDFELIPGTFEALKLLKDCNTKVT